MQKFSIDMNIRLSTNKEHQAIYDIHMSAFDNNENTVVANLTANIFNDSVADEIISLVAEENNKLIGNIIFTPVTIDKHNVNAYILAPLAVLKGYQRKGVGTNLVNHGLEILKSRGVDLVFVLGDVNYYQRFGFKGAMALDLLPPYHIPKYPEAWMVAELKPNAADNTKGTVKCCQALSSPELW